MDGRAALFRRIEFLIQKLSDGSQAPDERDTLIEDLSAWQASQIPTYEKLYQRSSPAPALPTDVFRFSRVASHDPSLDVRSFLSSGTTQSEKSTHPMRDLRLYNAAARAAARYALFPDVDHMSLVILAPTEEDAPRSSLSYMLHRFSEWFASDTTWVWQKNKLDVDALRTSLVAAESEGKSVALLGTSFAFVHAEDALADLNFSLPPGSRIMQTGGFKGRSRTVEPRQLIRSLSHRYGIDEELVVSEYGMTELSSQMYENTLREKVIHKRSVERCLWVPGWVRVTPVDADSLLPVPESEIGVLRIDDCANLDSVTCIQTADLARREGDGLVVIGRAAGATPRGCSLAIDIALSDES